MDMSQIEKDALLAKTTDTERKIILLELLKSKTNIRTLLSESHFEDITRMHKLFNDVYTDLKKEHEEEEKRKKEEASKRKVDQVFDALDVDNMDLPHEQIIEMLAARLGVKANIKKKEDKAKKGKGTRATPSTFVLKCTDDEGTEYRERNTSGQAGQLAKYCVGGKSLTDFIIGKLLKDEHESYYTNMNSKSEIIDATELKDYLASVNKQDKFIDASTLQNDSSEANTTNHDDEAANALAALNQNL